MRAGSGLITGWTGAGRSSLLQQVGQTYQHRGFLVQHFSGQPGPHRSLFAELGGGAQFWGHGTPGPELIEQLARALAAKTADRRLVLLVDDLHLVDSWSLTVLPLLSRRLAAPLFVTARTQRGKGFARPELVEVLRRCELAARLHLHPLTPAETVTLLTQLGSVPRARDLQRVQRLLGQAYRQPGLLTALWRQPKRNSLPIDAGPIPELRALPKRLQGLLAATSAGPIPHLARGTVAELLEQDPRDTARGLDYLTRHGWLSYAEHSWTASIPVVASTMARLTLHSEQCRALSQKIGPPSASPQPKPLPRREQSRMAVLRLVTAGHSNQAIASRLGMAPKTVEGHLTALLREYSCRNRAQLAGYPAPRPSPAAAEPPGRISA